MLTDEDLQPLKKIIGRFSSRSKGTPMDELLIGTLLPGAVAIHNQNINPVWRGNITLGAYRRQMYVKAVEPRTLAVEVICAILGRSLGLPIPRPALVQVNPNVLPGVAMPLVFFGSESVDNPDLKQWLKRDGEETMRQLENWAKLLDAGCFDEWTGNCDRHGGNILYGGGKNFVLIDHSEALPRGLKAPDPAQGNTLLSYASGGKTAKQLQELYTEAKSCSHPFAGTGIQQQVLDTLNSLSGQSTVDSLVAFLHQRTHSLLMLISQRIGHAQASLVLTK